MPADRWWRWGRGVLLFVLLFVVGLLLGAAGGWGLILLDPPHLGLLWLLLTRTLVVAVMLIGVFVLYHTGRHPQSVFLSGATVGVAALSLMWLDIYLNFLIPLAEMRQR